MLDPFMMRTFSKTEEAADWPGVPLEALRPGNLIGLCQGRTNCLSEVHKTQPIAQAFGVLALICVVGMAPGSLKFRGVAPGKAGVLFAGILVGRFGEQVDPGTLDFVMEFGLILFVFTIGLQLGPGFIAALRRKSVEMNAPASSRTSPTPPPIRSPRSCASCPPKFSPLFSSDENHVPHHLGRGLP
jgi:hypothetical protein